jgi:hypothetical protein
MIPGGDGFHELRVSLGDGMFVCLILRRTINRPERSLTSHPAFELGLDFLGTSLLERIGATCRDRCKRNQEQERKRLHLLIVGSDRSVARRRMVKALKR